MAAKSEVKPGKARAGQSHGAGLWQGACQCELLTQVARCQRAARPKKLLRFIPGELALTCRKSDLNFFFFTGSQAGHIVSPLHWTSGFIYLRVHIFLSFPGGCLAVCKTHVACEEMLVLICHQGADRHALGAVTGYCTSPSEIALDIFDFLAY